MLALVEADERPLPGRQRPVPPPRLRWLIWATVALAGIGAGVALVVLRSSSPTASPAGERVIGGPAATWAAGVRRAPALRLVDENGRPVSLAAQRGRPVIVTFIDPLCRNFCPLEAKRLDTAVRSLPRAERPAILAVSVNVYGNSRANLEQDVRKWRVAPQWSWAVGTPTRLARVWKAYDVGVLVATKKVAGVTVHEITHTEAAYIVDGAGDERALFLWPFTAADVEQSLRQLALAG
jgi:cytochrome oxidase Cu insertion factor (SCO1/SenC/PrrC family)